MNNSEALSMGPMEIENASMSIIEREMGGWTGAPENLDVVKRVVHATADFDFVKNLRFSEGAVSLGRAALSRGAAVTTDTNMAAAGISAEAARKLGVSVICRMSDPSVRDEALSRGVTRAAVSMERAVKETPCGIFAVGNAPTALIRLCELIDEGRAAPALVIGVPVGFVNVVESKERLARTAVPFIAAMGRKGGSTVASAVMNALLYGIVR